MRLRIKGERKDGLGCPLAYSPIGLNGQEVTSGEGHEGKGIISLALAPLLD